MTSQKSILNFLEDPAFWEDIFQNRTEQQTAMWESTLLCFTRCRAGASGAGKG